MAPRGLVQLVWASLLVSSALGALYTDVKDLPKTEYDYVIVGAGTAGATVAGRLAEDKSVSILVLEAGVDDADVLAAQVPLLGPTLTPDTLYDWNYTTVAQTEYNGRKIGYPRGKILGGSSTVNYMIYMRGSSDDWDLFAEETGDKGWKWDSMAKYITKHEALGAPTDHHDTTGEFDPTKHGYTGKLGTSLPSVPNIFDDRVLATLEEFPEDFPFTLDTVGVDVNGIGWSFSTIDDGARSSSATAYLRPALEGDNIDVLINAQATRLIQTGTKNKKPSFHSVEFSQDQKTFNAVNATKEIIVSGGVFGTPRLLQLSGIGDKKDLKSVGIDTIVDNPSVGANFTDHALLPNVFEVNSTETFDTLFRDSDQLSDALTEWLASQTGPLTSGVANQLGYLKLPENSTIFETTEDPINGPNSSHFELLFSPLWVVPGVTSPTEGNFFSISSVLISPTSRGTVKLASSDPFGNPVIDPQYVSTDFDLFTLVHTVKTIKKFVSGDAWKDLIIGPYDETWGGETDEEIVEYIRANAATIFHGTGTAAASAEDAPYGVVNPDLTVKGVEGVSVADVSVLPVSPNAHTQGPAYLVGERAADLIKARA